MSSARKAALAQNAPIGARDVPLVSLPDGVVVREHLGLVASDMLDGRIVHHARWSERGVYETRATVAPNGDYLLLFPDGGHYAHRAEKNNDMLAYRSSDKGKTWQGPTIAFDIDYNQHGFIPLIPNGTERIYAFGTQPIPGMYTREHKLGENAPIGYRYSDDNGLTWSEVRLIRPRNDPDFKGMSVMRMCETGEGTWILGSHESDGSYKPLMTRQYLLRSEDQGCTWEALPHGRHGGWCVPRFNRMDEGRPISLGGQKVYCMIRTCEGHLWATRSDDDGKTWADPAPTPLVHPDAPPMLFKLSDKHTLVAFHHNRSCKQTYTGLESNNPDMMDRSEIWASTSTDEGRSWSEPRFVFANALAPNLNSDWRNYNCSYCDMFVADGVINLFVPHRWERVLHLQLRESELEQLPTRYQLQG